jgi:hypothetical protein
MNGMDNEAYRNDIMKFIKYLNKWREFTGDYSRKPLVSYKYPVTMVSIYVHTGILYHHINMYKQTHKSKWISKYRDLIMGIKETELPHVYKHIRAYNNKISKLITRKRGMIR